MDYSVTLCVSLVLLLTGCRSEEVPCVYKVCRCAYGKVTCNNLSSIPEPVPGSETLDINMVDFEAGGIIYVGDNSLPPNLTTVNFVKNPISNISRHAFQASAHTLNSLVLRNVAVSKLPDALMNLEGLNYLSLANTLIQDWNPPVLQHTTSTLSSFSVDNVGITSWPPWLSSFALLQSIFILNSVVATIPDDAFSANKGTLQNLNLINISLTTVPKAFSSLQNLSSLSLSRNNLSDIRGIPACKFIDLSFNCVLDENILAVALKPSIGKLHTLYMESNNLTVIPDLAELTTMQSLVLSYNQIADSKEGTLPQSLSHLDLKGNRLSDVPQVIASLTNLENLDLTSNQITEILAGAIPSQLSILHLEANRIVKLTGNAFPIGSSLETLNLKSNPISEIDSGVFSRLKSVRDLNLDNSKLTTVPLTLTFLVSLTKLDMANVETLTCGCPRDEQLAQWFSSDKLLEVQGTCNGGTNLQEFYNKSWSSHDYRICQGSSTVSTASQVLLWVTIVLTVSGRL